MNTLTAHTKRGLIAGAVAGVAFGLLIALVANPLVAAADLGAGDHAAVGDHHEGTDGGRAHDHGGVVSATVTNAVSVLSGVLWGVLLGGVFGIGFYFLEPIVPGRGAVQRVLLAAAGFVTVSGAPWLVLPPRPPGGAATLASAVRLPLYAGMMALGAAVCLTSGVAYDRLRAQRSRPVAAAGALLPFALLAVPAWLRPVPSTAAGSGLSPELTAGFTGLIVFGQALLWFLLAGTHARLCRKSERKDTGSTVSVDSPAAD